MQWCISLGTQKAILLRVLNGSSPSSPIRRLHPLHTSCKKRLHLWKRNCFSDAENPQDTRNYLTSTLSLCPPLAAVWPLPQGSTGQQAVLDSSALSWMGLPSRWDAHGVPAHRKHRLLHCLHRSGQTPRKGPQVVVWLVQHVWVLHCESTSCSSLLPLLFFPWFQVVCFSEQPSSWRKAPSRLSPLARGISPVQMRCRYK